jgi:Ner family transcriptional regulator
MSMHKEDIKAAIRKKGETLSSLARKNEKPESTLRNALQKPVKCAELIIASFLEKNPHELWPDRWDENGQRIRPRYAKNSTAGAAAK